MTPTALNLTKTINPTKKYLEQIQFSDYIGYVAAKSATRIGILKDIPGAQPLDGFFCVLRLRVPALWQAVWSTRKSGRFPGMPVCQLCTVCHHLDWHHVVTVLLYKTRNLRHV